MGFLSNLFAFPHKNAWRAFSDEAGGQFQEGSTTQPAKIRLTYGPFGIVIDIQVVSTGKSVIYYTRLRAAVQDVGRFRFNLGRRNFLTGLFRWFRAPDIEVGPPEFNRQFVVNGSDSLKIKTLFDDAGLRRIIEHQKGFQFNMAGDSWAVRPRLPAGIAELRYQEVGIIKEPARFRELVELMKVTLDGLGHVGAIHGAAATVY